MKLHLKTHEKPDDKDIQAASKSSQTDKEVVVCLYQHTAYRCEVCVLHYNSQLDLKEHLSSHGSLPQTKSRGMSRRSKTSESRSTSQDTEKSVNEISEDESEPANNRRRKVKAPITCEDCRKTFKAETALKRHYCQAKDSSRDGAELAKRVKSSTKNTKPKKTSLICSSCREEFRSQTALKRHNCSRGEESDSSDEEHQSEQHSTDEEPNPPRRGKSEPKMECCIKCKKFRSTSKIALKRHQRTCVGKKNTKKDSSGDKSSDEESDSDSNSNKRATSLRSSRRARISKKRKQDENSELDGKQSADEGEGKNSSQDDSELSEVEKPGRKSKVRKALKKMHKCTKCNKEYPSKSALSHHERTFLHDDVMSGFEDDSQKDLSEEESRKKKKKQAERDASSDVSSSDTEEAERTVSKKRKAIKNKGLSCKDCNQTFKLKKSLRRHRCIGASKSSSEDEEDQDQQLSEESNSDESERYRKRRKVKVASKKRNKKAPYPSNESDEEEEQKRDLSSKRKGKKNTPQNKYPCGECNESFKTKFALKHHQQKHWKDEDFGASGSDEY